MGTPIVPLRVPARRVLDHLRRGPMTVDELAARMDLTPNAIRNQLVRLLDANLVERVGSRPGASKPSILFAITLDGQMQFSTIYLPVLTQFLRTAEEKSEPDELIGFMTETGRALGRRYPKPTGRLRSRAHAAARLLKGLGGIPELRTRNRTLVLESLGCPLSALTSQNRAACRILEGLISEYVGVEATTCCVLDPAPRCCFELGDEQIAGR